VTEVLVVVVDMLVTFVSDTVVVDDDKLSLTDDVDDARDGVLAILVVVVGVVFVVVLVVVEVVVVDVLVVVGMVVVSVTELV